MKRAAKKKERRVFTVSRRSEVAHQPERSTAADRDNPKGERENPKKEHRHQGHNSYRNYSQRLRMKIAEPLLLSGRCRAVCAKRSGLTTTGA